MIVLKDWILNRSDDRIPIWSLFLGITIWFIDLNAVYALPSIACRWGWFPFKIAGIQGLEFIEAVISVLAFLGVLYMGYLGWRTWRKFQTEKIPQNPRMLNDTEKDRRPLIAFISMLANGFFCLFIIATFVPMIALKACAIG